MNDPRHVQAKRAEVAASAAGERASAARVQF